MTSLALWQQPCNNWIKFYFSSYFFSSIASNCIWVIICFFQLAPACVVLISRDEVRSVLRRIHDIGNMQNPTTGVYLRQFVRTMQWKKQFIPKIILIHQLGKILEKVFGEFGERSKEAASKVNLQTFGWSATGTNAIGRCKLALENQTTLRCPDPRSLF